MLALVVDWSEESGVLEVFLKVLLVICVSPVSSWGQNLLRKGEESNVVLRPSEDIAQNTSEAAWSLLDAHLWSSNREVVSNFMFPEIAVLDHGSTQHTTLTNPDQIKIALTKDCMVLYSLTRRRCLRRH